MHEEDGKPTNENSHAYHFSITYNGYDFCLLTPSAILALLKMPIERMASEILCFNLSKILFSSLQLELISTAQRRAQKDAKHTKLLNLLCIV